MTDEPEYLYKMPSEKDLASPARREAHSSAHIGKRANPRVVQTRTEFLVRQSHATIRHTRQLIDRTHGLIRDARTKIE